MNNLPSTYSPNSPDQFVGPARKIAGILQRVVADALAHNQAPIKVLFNGHPGVGKSTLAKFVVQLLGCSPWSIKKYSGTDMDIETVRQIAADLTYKDLYDNYRFIWIEEADAIPPLAQTRFLLLLDDIPAGCAVVCTSNCKLDDFRERFQTRFKIYDVAPPTPQDIQILLGKFLQDKRTILQIANFARGNVRQALLDAETSLQAAA